jgi:hypothetical protein
MAIEPEPIEISEREIQEAANRIRVVLPEGVPSSMHAVYARQTIVESLTREKTRAAERAARAEHARQLQESLDKIEKENAQKAAADAEAADERAYQDQLAAIKAAFFAANRGCSELDWITNRKAVVSAAMVQRTLERLRGNESDIASIKTQLKDKYGDVI